MWNSDSYPPKKEMEIKGSHTFTGDTDVFNLTKTKHKGKSKTNKHKGKSKTRMSELSTSNKSDFYIGRRQS